MDLPAEPPYLSWGGVVLRESSPDDLPMVLDLATDPYDQLLTGLVPGDVDGARAWLERRPWRLARGLGVSLTIAEAGTGRAVGQIGLWLRASAPDGATGYREEAHGRAALGYSVAPAHRRRGHATDALNALSAWALELPDVHRLELFIEPWNEGSWRAAERAGYSREGVLRSWQLIGEERRDMFVYSRLRTDG